MTAKASDAYDQMKVIITTLFPSAKNIPNAYEPERAVGAILDNGFAIAIGPCSNRRSQMSCYIDVDRDYAVTLTRRVTTTPNNADARQDIEKTLINDQLDLIKAIDQNTTLNQVVSDCSFIGDQGIELLAIGDVGDSRYLVITSIFTCRYLEKLN